MQTNNVVDNTYRGDTSVRYWKQTVGEMAQMI